MQVSAFTGCAFYRVICTADEGKAAASSGGCGSCHAVIGKDGVALANPVVFEMWARFPYIRETNFLLGASVYFGEIVY
jgi:hypothetical protein